MKLGLGTVQFGLPYGISNTEGRTPRKEVDRILALAAGAGISVLDTAPAYGESEEVLGASTAATGTEFRVVTKTPATGGGATWAATLDRSLSRLGAKSVYGWLVHRPVELSDAAFRILAEARAAGKVAKIGVSVYEPIEADEISARYDIDLIQLPLSLLDQRFRESGCLERLKARGIEIHVRSAFLQGLLLMSEAELGPYFDPIRDHLAVLDRELAEARVGRREAAIGFVRSVAEVGTVVCGVNGVLQLEELIGDFSGPLPSLDWSRFAIKERKYLNPALWPKAGEELRRST